MRRSPRCKGGISLSLMGCHETPLTREGANRACRQGNDETREAALDIRRTFKLSELMLRLVTTFTHKDYVMGVIEFDHGLKWRKFMQV